MKWISAGWQWLDERIGYTEVVLPMLTHIVPSNA